MTPAPRRRLIKADLNLRLSNSFEEEDDDIVLARRGNASLSIPRSSLPSNVVQDIEEDDDEEEDNVFNGTGSGSKVFRKKMISNRRSSSSYSSSSSSSKASASSSHPPAAETEDDLLDRPTTDTTPRRKFSFRNREFYELLTFSKIFLQTSEFSLPLFCIIIFSTSLHHLYYD